MSNNSLGGRHTPTRSHAFHTNILGDNCVELSRILKWASCRLRARIPPEHSPCQRFACNFAAGALASVANFTSTSYRTAGGADSQPTRRLARRY